jgi:hypothetical protein
MKGVTSNLTSTNNISKHCTARQKVSENCGGHIVFLRSVLLSPSMLLLVQSMYQRIPNQSNPLHENLPHAAGMAVTAVNINRNYQDGVVEIEALHGHWMDPLLHD